MVARRKERHRVPRATRTRAVHIWWRSLTRGRDARGEARWKTPSWCRGTRKAVGARRVTRKKKMVSGWGQTSSRRARRGVFGAKAETRVWNVHTQVLRRGRSDPAGCRGSATRSSAKRQRNCPAFFGSAEAKRVAEERQPRIESLGFIISKEALSATPRDQTNSTLFTHRADEKRQSREIRREKVASKHASSRNLSLLVQSFGALSSGLTHDGLPRPRPSRPRGKRAWGVVRAEHGKRGG